MKAKDYLKNIKLMDAKIDADIEELATLQALAAKTSVAMDGERVQSSGSQQRMADVVCKIVELKEKITDEVDRLIDYKDNARKLVHEACDEDCIRLISKRYFGSYDPSSERTVYKTWEQIAIDLGFTYQWVSGGLHQRALAQLQKALDGDENG